MTPTASKRLTCLNFAQRNSPLIATWIRGLALTSRRQRRVENQSERQATGDERGPTHYTQFIQLASCNSIAGRGAGELNVSDLTLQTSDRESERAHPQARASSRECAVYLRRKERAAF